jgi:prolyl oligopeptidase
MQRSALVFLPFLIAACSGPLPEAKEATPKAAPSASAATKQTPLHPPTEKNAVSDSYHGVSVQDEYRWLEDWKNSKVKAWSKAQNKHARQYLDGLKQAAKTKSALSKILAAKTVSYGALKPAGGRVFAVKVQPPKQQPFIVVLDKLDNTKTAKVVVDPNLLDPSGHTHIDWYRPSPNGKMIAVSLSAKGTESGDVHIFDVATGKRVHEVIKRVNGGTAGGSLAWLNDSSGFYYTRYPRKGERPDKDLAFYVQVYFHKLGTKESSDRYELGKGLPRIAEYELIVDKSSDRLLITIQDGDGGEFAHYLRLKNGRYVQFSDFGDRTLQAAFGPKNDLFVLSRKGAPKGKILRVKIGNKIEIKKAKVVIEESKDTIVDSFWKAPSIVPTKNRLFVLYQLGGPSEIRVFDHKGKKLATPKQAEVGAAHGMRVLSDGKLLFENWSFVKAAAWYRYDPKDGSVQKTAVFDETPVDMSKIRVVREMATSKDGTQVPVNILWPPNAKKDGKGACVINGYGGYGVNLAPRYRSYYKVLLDRGVCYAIANLRGGGEYGEKWHREGNLTKKQNVFDDFSAVIKHMVAKKYVSPERVGIIGGSNGGLLMGATMTQHPALAKAVVSFVGIYDMLRVELSSNGSFNITEFGTVKKPDHFKALFAYSPYHRVKDGVAYPPTLMLTGENDPRVDPMQSRKMVARLQAASASKSPILLRTSAGGHGGRSGLKDRIAQLSDAYGFLFEHLGVD